MELPAKVALYVSNPEFLRWQDNPEEPRNWTGAARFLGLTGADKHADPAERLEEIRIAIQAALDWCKAQDTVYLTRGGNAGIPIHVSDLASVLDFLCALTYRFPNALEKRGRTHRFTESRGGRDEHEPDHEEPFWDWD